jgi:hypothetical protein
LFKIRTDKTHCSMGNCIDTCPDSNSKIHSRSSRRLMLICLSRRKKMTLDTKAFFCQTKHCIGQGTHLWDKLNRTFICLKHNKKSVSPQPILWEEHNSGAPWLCYWNSRSRNIVENSFFKMSPYIYYR